MEQLINQVNKLRKRVCEYRLQKVDEREVSTHLNAVDIVLSLVDYGIRDKRPIMPNEEHWFKAGLYLVYTFENSEWEDIPVQFDNIVDEAEKLKFFRK